eukprot:CAMPEP_0182890588 /NCGR_PEP_ID=MMETSP0034_2-20130328/22751_1 /TAXON_ID=156128 /ORGANISM="Nephroselmis pyriformis, Strain CCMP717" /LENGTH=95 /DNA_ID=CAMNT_0025024147 /DNA_START=646 /DNA_END=928 /DNA_ORIENTATION=+
MMFSRRKVVLEPTAALNSPPLGAWLNRTTTAVGVYGGAEARMQQDPAAAHQGARLVSFPRHPRLGSVLREKPSRIDLETRETGSPRQAAFLRTIP